MRTNLSLKLLVAFAFISFIILIGTSLIDEFEDFKIGYSRGWSEDNKDINPVDLPPEVYYLKVAPKASVFDFSETMVNLNNGQIIEYRNHQFKVALPSCYEIPKKAKNLKRYQTLLMLAVSVLFIGLLFMFVNVMRSLQKEVIFDSQNIKRIRKIGIFLIAIYFIMLIFNHFSFNINKQLFEFSEYVIIREKTNAITLFLGSLILIVAEVIKQGSQLKVEHDLTI